MFGRLIANWVYGGFLAGLLLALLAPILVHARPLPLVITFLCLPVYMIHQYEEHDNDRFRQFVNRQIGKGEVLSPLAVFIINVPGVWGIVGTANDPGSERKSTHHRGHRGHRGAQSYFCQSLPSTMRLIPSRRWSTLKLISSPTANPLRRM